MKVLEEKIELIEKIHDKHEKVISFFYLVCFIVFAIYFVFRKDIVLLWLSDLSNILIIIPVGMYFFVICIFFLGTEDFFINSVRYNLKKAKKTEEFLLKIEVQEEMEICYGNIIISVNGKIFSSYRDEIISQKRDIEKETEEDLDCILNSFWFRVTKMFLQKLRLL